MAIEHILLEMTYIAQADLSTKQFYGVKLSGADFGMDVCGAGEMAIGVLQDKPASGKAGRVVHVGICKALAGTGGVTRGVACAPVADGFAAASTGRTDTSDAGAANDPLKGGYATGIPLETATVGKTFSMLVFPMGAVPQTVQ
jgi:hypothetical protein